MDKMTELIIKNIAQIWPFALAFFTAIISTVFGFLVRSVFDKRDLRRKILDGPFNQFEEVTTRLAGFYRSNLLDVSYEINLLKSKQREDDDIDMLPGGIETYEMKREKELEKKLKKKQNDKINVLYQKMFDFVNESKYDLVKAKNNIIWASRRFKDQIIEDLINTVYNNLHKALVNYDLWHFEAKEQRRNLAQEDYKAYSDGLKAAQDYFDINFREDMEPLYRRYWHLSSRVGILKYPWDNYGIKKVEIKPIKSKETKDKE